MITPPEMMVQAVERLNSSEFMAHRLKIILRTRKGKMQSAGFSGCGWRSKPAFPAFVKSAFEIRGEQSVDFKI
ncbi:hypothetical protein [Rhizobium sp. PDO1-076]|uniref:hypothetical protein n=1 Tax=Rhizobium sp. PDO1-076 TaxID=1125979 RepID=UPI0011471D7E|nr:hypothetical protein [Rhizobium sp. PDO1-076]